MKPTRTFRCILIRITFLFWSSSFAANLDESQFVFSDTSIAAVIDVYEQITGKDIVADLEFSYPVNFSSAGAVREEEMVLLLEELIRIQGLSFRVLEGNQVELFRDSLGEFIAPAEVDVAVRLKATLARLRSNTGMLGALELKDESVLQTLSLMQKLASAPVIAGPGLLRKGPVNFGKSEQISAFDAFVALDQRLCERQVFLVEDDSGFLKALTFKPKEENLVKVDGVGVEFLNRSIPVSQPKRSLRSRGVVKPLLE